MASLLDQAPINLQAIREYERAELVDILESVDGTKHLVLDPALSDLLSHVLLDPKRTLTDNGVVGMSKLGDSQLSRSQAENILFFVRPNVDQMKLVASNIMACRATRGSERFNVYFAPHKTLVCEQVLEDEGVLDCVELSEYQLNLIPLDDDLISLELDRSFRECKLDGDTSSLQAVTQSITKLQTFYGIIPNVKSIGPLGRTVRAPTFSRPRPFSRPFSRPVPRPFSRPFPSPSPFVSPHALALFPCPQLLLVLALASLLPPHHHHHCHHHHCG
mmetsp:Transcript_57643/g.158760  ORF Transcript_57643/g.158760 Transcript_57643/m.158760 type:complete len:275 (-) Transcript_57643:1173-1997(-)